MSTPGTQTAFVQLPTADADRTTFVRLSSALTGYSTSALAPALDPIDLAGQYLAVVRAADLQTSAALFAAWHAIDTDPSADPLSIPPELVQERILGENAVGDLARRIIRLWYISIWYQSEPVQLPFGGPGKVISSNAYTGGLVWDAALAHPMGYSELPYGYWAEPPASAPAPSPAPTPNPW